MIALRHTANERLVEYQSAKSSLKALHSTFETTEATLREQLRSESHMVILGNAERKKLSETVDNMHMKSFHVESSLRVEMASQKSTMEVAEQAMIADASSQSQPLSDMLQKSMRTNQSLHDEVNTLRN